MLARTAYYRVNKMKDVINKISYIFDKKTKVNVLVLLIMILIGSALELLGVSIILPVLDLAMSENGVRENKFCRMIVRITGWNDDKLILLIIIAIMVLIYIIKNLYMVYMNNRIYTVSGTMHRNIATRLIKTYLSQPYSFFLQKATAELIRSVNSDTIGFYNAVYNVLLLISSGFTTICLLTFLMLTNWVVTMTLIGILGIFAVLVLSRLQKRTKQLGVDTQKLNASIIQTLQQAFEGVKEIKIFHKEQYFIEEFEDEYKMSVAIAKESNLLSSFPKYMIEMLSITIIMTVLAFNVAMGGESKTLIMQLSVFAVAAFKLLPSVNAIYAYSNTIMYNKASLDLVYNDLKESEQLIRDTNKKLGDVKIHFKKSICLNNISFQYSSSEELVLDRVSLTIKKGQSVALIGPSGGGKTTTADLILGLLQPTGGTVTVDGRNIQECYNEWLGMIGYIPQFIFLYDDTIRRNIAFGLKEEEIDDNRVWCALEEAKLRGFVESLPKGIHTSVGEKGVRLSGGQRQRIGIARALYSNPEILVFDEATSALDGETERDVMESIEGLQGTKTLIIIAHRLSTIERCDTVYKVERGSVSLEKQNS